MFFFADDRVRSLPSVVVQRLFGMFQQVRLAGRFARRHRRRQIVDPLWMHRESAHHLQRGERSVLGQGHGPAPIGLDAPLAQDILDIEHVVVLVLRRETRWFFRRKWPDRFVVATHGRHLDQFLFRVAQRREIAAKDTAGIDAYRVVQPLGFRYGRVAVDDHGIAAVLRGPVVAHGKSVLVGFARGFAIQRERAHGARAPSLEGFLHARVGNDQPSPIEDIVADQSGDEGLHPVNERFALAFELLDRLGEPVGQLDVPAGQLPEQLGLVVAGHADRDPILDHVHDQAKHAGAVGSAIHQVADEHGPSPVGRGRRVADSGFPR